MISLSLCMIVKNEEAVLERILKPVSQVMDAILIADTGSSDRTKEIAEQYTSQVFDFPWCDDFSAPRNFLLEKVRTDYWMWLDADDVLDEENLEKLKSLKETLDPGTDVVMMEYAAGFDQSGRTTFSYFRERIMKTSRNFRWNGAVHETVIPEGNIIYSDVVIRHRNVEKVIRTVIFAFMKKCWQEEKRWNPDISFIMGENCIIISVIRRQRLCWWSS